MPRLPFLPLLAIALLLAAAPARADVIVLTNRTSILITGQISPLAAVPFPVKLAPADVLPVFVDGRAYINFTSRGEAKRYLLDANSAYYFGESAKGMVDLQKIGLGEDKNSGEGRTLPGRAGSAPMTVIPVKILVDEEQPLKQAVWERQLRARVASASAILEKYARVELKVVAADTWTTDNSITDFFESLGEFEHKVKPFPAQLAIGFTSQYQMVTGRVHLAGTRGPLSTHIFVREWSQHISEPERLELLVHELGHFLGAAHSPEPTSVMRPVLGNKQAVRVEFQVRFDPVNALIIGMVGEEMGRRKIQRWSQLTPGTKDRLRQIYGALAQTLPTDPAAGAFIQSVNPATLTSLELDTKQVLARITQAAQANSKLPLAGPTGAGGESRREGDALTDYLVRQAADTAKSLPTDTGPMAFIFALGIGLDNSDVLRIHPKTGTFVETVEPASERAVRLAALGLPTLRGRRDLCQHFVVSAYLTAALGTETATETGLAKELMDSEGSEGFSFVDMTANRAGILFAGGVLRNAFTLSTLADGFTVATYMPPIDDIPEGLSATQLIARFGLPADPRFQKQLKAIDQRVLELPAYRGVDAAKNH
jgi:matrixin